MRRLLLERMLCGAIAVGLVLAAVPAVAVAADPGGHAAAEGEPEAHPQGAPLEFQADLALWSLVVFLVFVGVLWKFAWGPLAEGLDRRETRIRRDLEDAEAARLKAEKLLAEHAEKLEKVQDEVNEIIAEARRDAERTRDDILSAARAEAEATRKRAIEDINRARDQAIKDLFDRVIDQVTLATEKVLGRSLTPEDHKRLVRESLEEVAEVAAHEL